MSKGAAWRAAGMNYLQYSSLCARLVRRALKEEHKVVALRREEHGLKMFKWENGKATAPKELYDAGNSQASA